MAIVINGSGTVTGLAVGGLPDGTVDSGTLATDSVTAAKLEVSAITGADLPAGSVLQVVSVAKTDTFSGAQSANSMSGTNVTNLIPVITPSSSSNKILVTVSVHLSSSGASGTADNDKGFKLFRSGTAIATGASAGSRTLLTAMQHHTNQDGQGNMSMTFLDSPSTTSEINYSIRLFNGSGSTNTMYVNRGSDGDAAYTGRTISTITLMEIAG